MALVKVEVSDLLGLAGPAAKCVKVISEGMGTLYPPRAMRQKADAKAYEILAIANAEAAAGAIAAQGKADAQLAYFKTLSSGDLEIYDRARARLIAREVEGQQNVESIAENALRFLPEKVSDEPVSPDWRRKFFLEAENVCDEDMQELWGRVLAGEVATPGSFGLRTLTVLNALSREEAELFRLACSLAYDGGEIIVGENGNPLAKYGLQYSALMRLTHTGLLHAPSFVHHQLKDLPADEALQTNNGVHIILSGPLLKSAVLPVLTFTLAGQELQRLVPPNPCMQYLNDTAKLLRERYKLTVKRVIETKQEDGSAAIAFTEDF